MSNKRFEIVVKNRIDKDVKLTFEEHKYGGSNYGCDKSIALYMNDEWFQTFDVRYTYISDFKGDLEYFVYWYITTQWYGFKGDYFCDRYEVITCYRDNKTKELDLDSISYSNVFTSRAEAIEKAESFKGCLDADDDCEFSEVVVIYKIDKDKWDYQNRTATEKTIVTIIDSNE